MTHTREKGCRDHNGKLVKPQFKPIHNQLHVITVTKSAAKHTTVSKALLEPICEFHISVTKAKLPMD